MHSSCARHKLLLLIFIIDVLYKNKALTLLYSVVKHAGTEHESSEGGNTRRSRVFLFSSIFETISSFGREFKYRQYVLYSHEPIRILVWLF